MHKKDLQHLLQPNNIAQYGWVQTIKMGSFIKSSRYSYSTTAEHDLPSSDDHLLSGWESVYPDPEKHDYTELSNLK